MTLLDRAIVKVLPAVPRLVVRRISSRYIAGSELDDGLWDRRQQTDDRAVEDGHERGRL